MKVDSCTNLLDFSVVCPLQADQFAYELKNHPNQAMVFKLLKGIRERFEIGSVNDYMTIQLMTIPQRINILCNTLPLTKLS